MKRYLYLLKYWFLGGIGLFILLTFFWFILWYGQPMSSNFFGVEFKSFGEVWWILAIFVGLFDLVMPIVQILDEKREKKDE